MCENCLSVECCHCCHSCCGANNWIILIAIALIALAIICCTIAVCVITHLKYSSQENIRREELNFQRDRMAQQENNKKSNECKSGNDNVTTANQKTQGYFVQVTPIE